MLQLLNTLLTKNAGLREVFIVALFALSYYQNIATNQLVKDSSYQYEYKLISYALADVNTTDEAVELARKWSRDKWGAQIAAAEILCDGPGREKLTNLIGVQGTASFCRVAR